MNLENHDERIIRSSFSAEDFDNLTQFFQNVWMSNASYKVFMARRAFNLNYAFMDIMKVTYRSEYKIDNIMSNTALLLCAEEIADYYVITKCFPDILIVDDLLLHGRGISKLINNLEALIIQFIMVGHPREKLEDSLHSKLRAALNIYVFARNTNGVLLDKQFALKAFKQLPASELKTLSQQISRALQQCVVANTSYVLSAELPLAFYKKEYANRRGSDGKSLFQYRGNVLRYYYRNTDNKIFETIRAYYDVETSLKRTATSLVIFGNISYFNDGTANGFNSLCRYIADEINKIIPYSRIASILRYNQKLLARARAQMLSYLLSICSYADFYRELISDEPHAIYKALLQSDYKKIITNFDKSQKLQSEIARLFYSFSHDSSLEDSIFEALSAYIGRVNQTSNVAVQAGSHSRGRWEIAEHSEQYDSKEGPNSKGDPHEVAEDIFYEIGINSECDANEYARSHRRFDPSVPGRDYIHFQKYLDLMKKDEIGYMTSVACALNLMDSGLLAMNLEVDSENRIQCILKAGELSTFVLPRRFFVFIPALSIVERGYLRKGFSAETGISKFIDYLQNHCYQEEQGDNQENIELLRKLWRSKAAILYMYNAGQKFQDWDVNLLTTEDRISHGLDDQGRLDMGKYLSWASEEDKKERFYSYYARVFLRANGM